MSYYGLFVNPSYNSLEKPSSVCLYTFRNLNFPHASLTWWSMHRYPYYLTLCDNGSLYSINREEGSQVTLKPGICISFYIKIFWKVSCVLSPCRYYAIMVTMFFTVSVMNNYALNLNIAMPLHMIFRSVSASSHVCPLKSMVRWADRAWDRNSQSYRKSSLGRNDRLALRLWTGWESGKWMAYHYLSEV